MKKKFEDLGGEFVLAAEKIAEKLANIKAFVFDWDGVFSLGAKGVGVSSSFTEADSMGTNMLRYSHWRKNEKKTLAMAIITGANNPTAIQFAQREHFHAVYSSIHDKSKAIEHFCLLNHIAPEQVACCFDDVNDFPMARICGLRFMVRRAASPLLLDFAREHQLCDYITGSQSGQFAVREITDLVMGMHNVYKDVIFSRIAYDDDYQAYFKNRQTRETVFFTNDKQREIVPMTYP
ncbi:phosphatase [uncultured Microscilla sp.]|uniref:phosphatase n=1 Tax=uncultured Microscilla sp. TaxID=432653 RepID=UPI00262A07BF|nr:phosphatase [uncultured Microscilla sp.]